MKRIFSLAMTASLVFGLASCSKENTLENGMEQTGKAAVQFTVTTAKGGLTYADIAQGAEWTINSVDAYVFKASDGSLLGSTTGGSPAFTVATASGTTTITASDGWVAANKGTDVEVYFVGNNASANLFGSASHVTGTIAAKADLIHQLSVAQQLDAGDNNCAKLLTAPLLFSASGTATVPSVGKVSVPVTLKRREARFDIVNTINATFTIDKVVVKNANINGYIFADGTGKTMTTASLKEIDCSGLVYDADGLATSVFYLYPSQLGVGSNTEIAILATVNGVQTAYPVKTNIKAEANKRYKLVLDPAKLEFVVTPADYDEGVDLPVEPLTALSISNATGVSGNGSIVTGGYLVANDGVAAKVTFDLFATSSQGVNISAFDLTSGVGASATATSTTDATLTYSTIGYKTTVTVDIAGYSGTKNFDGQFTITDKQDPRVKAEYYIRYTGGEDITGDIIYPGTAFKAVKVGNVYWAPLNVGATDVTGLLVNTAGRIYQFGRGYVSFPALPSNTDPGDIITGPVTLAEASTTYADKFIKHPGTSILRWASDATDAYFWIGDNAQGPCPTGWRLPTQAEYIILAQKFDYHNLDGVNSILSLAGDIAGEKLYIPFAGRRYRLDGIHYEYGNLGHYWTSTQSATNTMINIAISTSGFNTTATSSLSNGFSIRCVKATE